MKTTPRLYYIGRVLVRVKRDPHKLALDFYSLDFCNNDRFPI